MLALVGQSFQWSVMFFMRNHAGNRVNPPRGWVHYERKRVQNYTAMHLLGDLEVCLRPMAEADGARTTSS